MTTTPEHRSLLRLVPHARGKRSPVTCELKCGNACAHEAPNGSDNDYFPDVASRALSRRGVLGAAGGALALALAPATSAAAAGTASGTRGPRAALRRHRPRARHGGCRDRSQGLGVAAGDPLG